MEKRYLRSKEAAQYLGVSYSWLLKHSTDLPVIKWSSYPLYDREDLDEFMRRRKEASNANRQFE